LAPHGDECVIEGGGGVGASHWNGLGPREISI
jgi:hypothetical protein